MTTTAAAALLMLTAALLAWPAARVPRERLRALGLPAPAPGGDAGSGRVAGSRHLRFLGRFLGRLLGRPGGPGGPVPDRAGSSAPPVPVASGAAVRRARWWAVVSGAAAVALLGASLPALAAAVVTAGLVQRLVRRALLARDVEQRRRALNGQLPAACDLLAVCLAAGVPVSGAVGAVAGAVAEPLAGELRTVAGLYRLGAAAGQAWRAVPDELRPLGRVVVRAGESGSSVGAALRALAAEGRAADRAATETAVRRAGVWVLAPLGACFLPAFLCLGVVPLVLGIAGQVLP